MSDWASEHVQLGKWASESAQLAKDCEAREERRKINRRAVMEPAARHGLLEATQKDAARYRWLRDTPWPPELADAVALHQNAVWDRLIDAAMREEHA